MATNSKIKKTVNALLYFLIVFFALIAVLTLFNLPGGYRLFSVQSGSMEPKIKTGSVVFNARQDDYNTGDVITFQTAEKQIVTHRVIEKRTDRNLIYFIVQGDANDAPDSAAIPSYNVIGKVLFTIPLLGYLVSFLKTPLGVVALVVVPATILVWEEIGKLKSEIKKLKKGGRLDFWSEYKKRVALEKLKGGQNE